MQFLLQQSVNNLLLTMLQTRKHQEIQENADKQNSRTPKDSQGIKVY